MRKILVLVLALMLGLSLAACTDKPASGNNEQSGTESTKKIEATECTPEAYDKAVKDLLGLALTDDFPTYDEVVEMFGAQGKVNTELEYEGYSYYNFTDGKRTALLTFKVSNNVETYFAITGDIVDLMF